MWNYSKKVQDYFVHPHNAGPLADANAIGEVGSIACGDALKLYLKINDQGVIEKASFETFGCASAIASSSALTELVKGMTLDEAAKVTNKDIVALLGQLPEEKMHCSVMGMEALQAAIADYKAKHGEAYEKVEDDPEDHEGRIVCHCFGVTDTKIRRVARENNLHTAEQITQYTKAGGACGACLDQIQEILDGLWKEHKAEPAQKTEKVDDFNSLSVVQKVIKVQSVIDREIRPQLEHDGGDIELVDIQGTQAIVRLKGHCASCMAAKVTLKNLVEAKLREFVSDSIEVVEAK